MRGLMKSLGLVRRRARYAHYRRATKPSNIAPNVLARRFNPTAPNTFWAGDITYIRVGASWLYLAVVMDLFSRRIVGWAFSRTADAELSLRALQLAVGLRRPASELVFHSDQGCQGGFNRSSQHWIVVQTLGAHSVLRQVFSSRVFFEVWC